MHNAFDISFAEIQDIMAFERCPDCNTTLWQINSNGKIVSQNLRPFCWQQARKAIQEHRKELDEK